MISAILCAVSNKLHFLRRRNNEKKYFKTNTCTFGCGYFNCQRIYIYAYWNKCNSSITNRKYWRFSYKHST